MTLRPRRATLRWLRAFIAQGGIVVVACVLLLGVLRAGARYYVCPAMNLVLDAPCCGEHDESDDGDEDGSALRGGDCCRARHLASMPVSAVSAVANDVAASPCVAFLPARTKDGSSCAATSVVRFTQPARAGPATAAERRADLMVWLI